MSSKAKNLIGKRFGRWIVLERKGSHLKLGALWLVKCDCGNEKIIAAQYLVKGGSKSCGCLRLELVRKLKPEKILPNNQHSKNQVLIGYKRSALKRGLCWTISEGEFFEFLSKNCYYCGSSPNNIHKTGYDGFVYTGLDRVDNNKGYEKHNVVPCCIICNRAKGNLNYADFNRWLDKIISHSRMVHSNF